MIKSLYPKQNKKKTKNLKKLPRTSYYYLNISILFTKIVLIIHNVLQIYFKVKYL